MFTLRPATAAQITSSCSAPVIGTQLGQWSGIVPPGIDGRAPITIDAFAGLAANATASLGVVPAVFVATFQMPVTASILWAVGGDAVQEALTVALCAAADRTVQYLSANYAFALRGPGGVAQIELQDGVTAGMFCHPFGPNRKPSLHLHAFVVNAAVGDDGRWSGLDQRALLAAEEVAHEYFASALRSELAEQLDVVCDVTYRDDRRTQLEIAGVDRSIMASLPALPHPDAAASPWPEPGR